MTSNRHGSVEVDEDKARVTTILEKNKDHALVGEESTLDDTTLAALGYKQEFKR